MGNQAEILIKQIKEQDIGYIEFRFTDTKGIWHHVTFASSIVDADMLQEGIMFDGSSIAGWKTINESDMLLRPALSDSLVIDPFFAQKTAIFVCDVLEPYSGKPYSRDPRSIAVRAEAYMLSTGIADTAYFGPEAEFFIFDSMRYSVRPSNMSVMIDSEEAPCNSHKNYAGSNLGHRPRVKGGYFPVPPVDSCQDMRSEMLSVLTSMGVKVEKHHHEVAASQHELGIEFGSLVQVADHMQIYKYVVRQVADSYNKTATFMPKPVKGDNGSGMHVHQSLWKDGKPLFSGDGYADLSETCLYYIGGIIKHARALNAFTNPSTNSYKRLIPGFEAPVILAYSARNRSASIRIPFGTSPKTKRIECRFPDPMANPYIAYSAMLMAGLDGIRNKIHPGEASDQDLYELSGSELAKLPQVCGSLREALVALSNDRDFLKQGDVFSDDFIDSYIDLHMQSVHNFEHTPHPVEFDMYYSL